MFLWIVKTGLALVRRPLNLEKKKKNQETRQRKSLNVGGKPCEIRIALEGSLSFSLSSSPLCFLYHVRLSYHLQMLTYLLFSKPGSCYVSQDNTDLSVFRSSCPWVLAKFGSQAHVTTPGHCSFHKNIWLEAVEHTLIRGAKVVADYLSSLKAPPLWWVWMIL